MKKTNKEWLRATKPLKKSFQIMQQFLAIFDVSAKKQ
jgi:hypothetical protein